MKLSFSQSGRIIPSLSSSCLTRGSMNNESNITGFQIKSGMTDMEYGRSMVEMLGILAVIGVLSIGGIMGYNYAIAKYKANEISSELNLRAIVLSQQQTQSPKPAETTLTMDMGNTMKTSNDISAEVSVNPEYFEITVADVEKQACELILQDYTTPAWMIINGTLYENTPTVCDTDKNTMTFVYKNDLGEKRNCTTKGFFNTTSYKCECAGGTYFDNTAKDCVCPAGTKWTGAECTEARCADNEFEALDGCISCDDPKSYSILDERVSITLCKACPNRFFSTDRNMCIHNNNCILGEEIINISGGCTQCSASNLWLYLDPTADQILEYCRQCSNRYLSFGGYGCVKKDACAQNKFFGIIPGDTYTCHSCDTAAQVKIGRNSYAEEDKNMCLSCGRTIIQDYQGNYFCVKSTCDSGEFKGKDGICYKCTEPTPIELENDIDGCLSCKRITEEINEKTYCKVDDCSSMGNIKYTRLKDGSCYSCATSTSFKSTLDECNVCGTQRGWTYSPTATDTIGYCRLNTCVKGTSYPYHGVGSTCYTCMGMSGGDGCAYSGVSNYAREYCEACEGNYLAADGYCYTPNSCNKGSEFRAKQDAYHFCTSCDYIDKVKMAGHEEHDKMCAACITTPRFFADNYCYRCDSNESPVVITPEERASCTACPNRQINSDNQCVLIVIEK